MERNPQEKDYCEIENESDGVNVSNISNVSDKNEFEHKFTIAPILARRNGQNHVFEIYSSIYKPRTKCVRYKEEEARVLARITSKIKEFIQYYGFESDPTEMRK